MNKYKVILQTGFMLGLLLIFSKQGLCSSLTDKQAELQQLIQSMNLLLKNNPELSEQSATIKGVTELNNIVQAKQKQGVVAFDDHSTRYGVFGYSIEDTAVDWEEPLTDMLRDKKLEGSVQVGIYGTLPSFLKYRGYWQNLETVKNPDHDERQAVLQPSWPYNTSVRLVIEFPDKKTIGSGTIVLNNRTILTAGHCIYDPHKGGFADSITVEYRNDQNNEWGYKKGDVGVITSGWFTEQKPSCDYGLIVLEEPIGINCMGLAIEDEIDNLYINTAGFPKKFKDRIVNTFEDDPCLYAAFGVLKRGGCPLTLYHSADTKKGQSGSGLWTYDQNHKAYCCGIHTAGFKRTEDNKNNKGILISSVPFQRIYQWINHAPTLAIN
jgi:V8-like Glu-specific endopeptidase